MTKWQMLSLVFNGVNFSRNSIFCPFFFLLPMHPFTLRSSFLLRMPWFKRILNKMKYIQIIQNDRSKVADASSFLAINDVIMALLLLLKGQCPDYAQARASSVFSSKDNRTVISTRQDFLPGRTADRDLLFIFLSLIHIWRCRRIERCRSRWSPYH